MTHSEENYRGLKAMIQRIINYYHYSNIMYYHELWNVLWNWKREFSVKEFSSTFVSPNSNKVLHDMASKGLLERGRMGQVQSQLS